MYNAEQKERFLTAREYQNLNIRKLMNTFWKISEPFENAYGKDCSNFTTQEISEMYSSILTHSLQWLYNFNSQMQIYTSWCLSQNLIIDNQNHYNELTKKELALFVNVASKDARIISKDDLLSLLPTIPNVSDQFLALAIFEGLGGNQFADFYNLTMDSFDGNNVTVGERTLHVSDKLVALAKKSANEYEKYDKYPHRQALQRGYKHSDESIIKDSANAGEPTPARNQRKIYMRLYKLEQDFGVALGYNGLHNSGRIDMIKSLMIKDQETDIKKVIEQHKSEIEYRYGNLHENWSIWLNEYQKYMTAS